MRRNSWLHALFYRVLGICLQPVLKLLLAHRIRQGKEDPQRQGERYGQPSQPPFEMDPLWIHGASVGEITAGLSLARWMRVRHPHLPLLLTTTTRTGADYVSARLPAHSVHQYIPFDIPCWMSSFLEHWHPKALVLIESEFWPNLLRQLRQQRRPSLSLDSHLSARSYARWRRAQCIGLHPFPDLTRVYVSSPDQGHLLRTLGAPDVRMIAPLKFANEPLMYSEPDLNSWRHGLDGRWVWLAASTHEGEEAFVLDVHQQLKHDRPDTLLILAPRHMNRLPVIQAMLDQRGLSYQRYSDHKPLTPSTECILVDTFGVLGLFYRLCPGAFVGGSLVPHVGGHNIIEPLQVGCIPFHGPYMSHAPHIVALCRGADLDLQVHDVQNAVERLKHIYEDPRARAITQERARTLCQSQCDQIMHVLDDLFESL